MITQYVSQYISPLVKPFELTDNQTHHNRKSLRWLAWYAMTLGFAVLFVGKCIYGLDYTFTSISASANFYGTAYLLPFVLGGMAIFFWDYFGYAKIDRVCTKSMSVAAIVVAMFQCNEFSADHDVPSKIGLLGLSPRLSNLMHTTAAIVLFSALIIWIVFLFTKTRKGVVQCHEKIVRNRVYRIAGVLACIGLVSTVCHLTCTHVPYVWLGEVVILIPSGFALLVKSNISWFKDK